MTPAIANYKNFVRGDTIDERLFTIKKTINSVESPVDLTSCSIKVDFVFLNTCIRKQLGDGLTMIDAAQGKFKIDSFSLSKAGTWDYDIEITFTNGAVKTWVKGEIIIENDVTK